jgi:hypothetical protein
MFWLAGGAPAVNGSESQPREFGQERISSGLDIVAADTKHKSEPPPYQTGDLTGKFH